MNFDSITKERLWMDVAPEGYEQAISDLQAALDALKKITPLLEESAAFRHTKVNIREAIEALKNAK